jgi:hypothetical protein
MDKRRMHSAQTLSAETAARLLDAVEEQADMVRREAAKAGDLSRSLQYQYLLGMGAGLNRAAAMIRAATQEHALDSHKPAA